MSQIDASWALPPDSPMRRAIKEIKIEGRQQQDPPLDWSPVTTLAPADPQEFQIANPLPGTWEFQWTIVDVTDTPWLPYVASVDVGFDISATVENVSLTYTP